MTKNDSMSKEDIELFNLMFEALFSGNVLDSEDENKNELENLFLDKESLEELFKRPKQENNIITDNNKKNDKEMVNHPAHYNQSPIETMEKFILMNHDNPDKIKGALEFNIIKYTDRVGHKNSTREGIKEDNSKTKFYYELYELLFPESVSFIELYRVWKKSKK